jgi:hypothetical protein
MIISLTLVLISKLKIVNSRAVASGFFGSTSAPAINALNQSLIRRKKLILLTVVLLQVLLLSVWAIDVIKNTWGEHQIKIIDAQYQSIDGRMIKLEQSEIENSLSCAYFRCESHLPSTSKIFSLNDGRDWMMGIRYHCKNLNKDKFTTSKIIDGLHKFDLDCY